MISPLKVANIFKVYKEWLDFEPLALWTSIRDEVMGVDNKDLPENVKNMIMAVRSCMKSSRPYEEWDVFENVAVALNDEVPIVDEIQEMFTPEVAYAVKVMRELNPSAKWSDEVKAYISVVAKKDGYIALPSELIAFQGVLDGMTKSTDGMRDNIHKRFAEQQISGRPKSINTEDYISVGADKLWQVKDYISRKDEK